MTSARLAQQALDQERWFLIQPLDPYPGGHTETGEDTHTTISRRGLVRQHRICSGSARGWETALECVHCNKYTAPHLAFHVQLVAPTHGRAVLAFCCARMLNERVGQLQALSQLQTLGTQTRSRRATPFYWAPRSIPRSTRSCGHLYYMREGIMATSVWRSPREKPHDRDHVAVHFSIQLNQIVDQNCAI